MFSCESCEISKGTFFHKTSLVAASVLPSEFQFWFSIVRMCLSKGTLICCIYIGNDNPSFFSIKSSILSDCTTSWLPHPHVFYCITSSVYVENKCIYKTIAYINKANVNRITKLNKITAVIYFEWVFLTPPTKRPPTNRSTNHLPPTTDQMHRPPINQPLTNKKYDNQKFHNKF